MLNRTSILKQPNKISYFDNVLELQQIYQNALINRTSENQLVWMGEHPLCYTIGRGGDPQNILPSLDKKNTNIFKINRGGEVTCHMPGQLVVYLIFDLNNYKKDLNWYLRKIEKIIIKILQELNIDSSRRNGLTGVWCDNKKIASIGVGCKRWVTMHGFALNVDCNLSHFDNIVPCGIEGCIMTKIDEFNPYIKIIDVKEIVKKIIQEEFNLYFVSE